MPTLFVTPSTAYEWPNCTSTIRFHDLVKVGIYPFVLDGEGVAEVERQLTTMKHGSP